ncbi:MAG: MerR family transcriptional regulator [Chloroflexota bacterium]|nr:MAG: MerR family transcriptional regulator [Chloroflexota bacterium]
MYTISQAAARSGVAVALLRAWERRYGVVAPSRTPSGYRLYDDAAIARLRAMRALIDSGWSASQAAEAVATGSADAGVVEPGALEAGGAAGDQALVVAASTYDTAGIETAIDEILARGSYEAVIDDGLLPAVAALGTAWAAGRIDVAAEHLASAAVQRRLAALFDLGGRPRAERSVVVGLPPGCRHEIGTLAFAVALRRRGVDVLYLGPDTPVASWAHAALDGHAVAAVIGVPRRADVGPAREVVAALAASGQRLIVAIGGPAAGAVTDGPARLLPVRVTDAAAALASVLATD